MKKKQIEEIVINEFTKILGLNNGEVTIESSIKKDLGADSLDVIEATMNLEKELNISIPDITLEKMTTISDVVDEIENLMVGGSSPPITTTKTKNK